jgi:hypothetical protein
MKIIPGHENGFHGISLRLYDAFVDRIDPGGGLTISILSYPSLKLE